MYYKHFNLNGPPFQFTPSADVLYPSRSHQEALAALEWGLLHEPSGLTMLIGEPGTGKTTLISSILARDLGHVRIAYVGNPRLSFDEILQVVCRQLGIACASPQRLKRLDAIEQYLEAHRRRERVTVVIDEAQVLPDDVVDELRLLSNAAPGRETALRFVFVGQPEFLRRLESPSLRQLNERIGARAMLNPLQPNEIGEYIDFRLRARGGTAADIFTSSALKHIAEHSGGIPRRINVLCHNAMLLAYTGDNTRVRAEHAHSAVAEYENLFSAAAPRSSALAAVRKSERNWRAAAAVAAVGAAAVGAACLWSLNSARFRDYGSMSQASASDVPRASVAATPEAANIDSISASSTSRIEPASTVEAAAPTPAAPPIVESAARLPEHEPEHSERRMRQVRVRFGDTVEQIARRYLGSKQKIDAVIEANPQLDDVNRIYPGEVIYVPAPGLSRTAGK